MPFEKDQVYNFTVEGVVLHRDTPFFLLSYEGQETMSAYKDDGWVFRVKVLDFQREGDPNTYIGKQIPCTVKGYNVNDWGKLTQFPKLEQSVNHILREKFTVGVNYDFEIVELPGYINAEGRRVDAYKVRDEFGFYHKLKLEGLNYSKGQQVNLRVSSIEGNCLRFAHALLLELSKHFKEDSEYQFEVLTEEANKDYGGYFFTLREKNGLPGVHRFHFKEEREDGPGDIITLKVKGFSKKGWLILGDPVASLTKDEWERIAFLEDDDTPKQEGQKLEYKSSFVFTANSICNIDEQLGCEIMRQIAAFMNADGGELRIGYKDNGEICGINNDLPHINSSNEDNYTYDLSEDKIKLKFMNVIAAKLGNLVASRVQVDLFKTEDKKLVCHIVVQPSPQPVWCKGNHLYVRCQNSARLLMDSDITQFICERCYGTNGNMLSSPAREATPPITKAPAVQVAPSTEKLTPVRPNTDLSTFRPVSQIPQNIWTHITLYTDGTVSQQKKEQGGENVLLNIPVGNEYKRKSTKSARLLLCYDNGRVKVLNPKEVIEQKLTRAGKVYANGYNQEDGAKLLKAFVCRSEDYLVLHSRKHNGMEMVKAVHVASYRKAGPTAMQTKGNLFIKPELAVPYDMEIVPSLDEGFIKAIVCKPSEKYGPGYAVQSSICKDAVEYLNRRRHLKAQVQG